ncbi:MAG: TetR family transcriptional regulator [Microbacterium sp.]|uniref:TetR family transcriptional regulator n=1 Tax=Microbacterium sp. TaxID=51671 RepID=UPI001ACB3597|nr:TetR family transcriptional regulator [Microbacterium sp.]MBN9169557.1 TetR family transcriptional regulator [Microbacterium sp.]MBN9171757.1 TetR family transcriptional regulator [Microbacterium sp.]MBN9179169.1 TetR family transcriptional regulator [Microbacterium sp.]MBN9192321.1 TetR family transcriptional regulator [Microbacterium sp.]MBN9194460.1 TetR family transcriptional regulator [Microbacterium sp.]
MGRWQSGARERLVMAALDLYVERGFDETTVAEIAARAGVTERTFFRYFADKREVLFEGSALLEQLVVQTIADAPVDASAFDAAIAGVRATREFLVDRDFSRRRAAAIDANASLRERELLKLASLRDGIATALRARGTDELTAAVAADAAGSVFHHGFQRWIRGDSEDYSAALEQALAAVRGIR